LIRLTTFVIIIIWFTVASCDRPIAKKQGNVLARVNDTYLYDSDLRGLVPEGTSPKDSISVVKSFVRNWVKTTLIVQQAEINLSSRQLNFDKQLNDYKNSLIIFEYEREWIRQNLDTIVPDSEIKAYYEEHISDFELKENIAKLMFVVLNKDINKERLFDKTLSLPDSLMLDSLENLCKEYSTEFYLDTATWVTNNWIEDKLPIEVYNPSRYLNNNTFVKITEDDNLYLIKFIDYRIKDDISPIDFEFNHIRNIIINKRKMHLAKKLREDIYENAILNNKFEIYYNEHNSQ
jgi:hypothetical protein